MHNWFAELATLSRPWGESDHQPLLGRAEAQVIFPYAIAILTQLDYAPLPTGSDPMLLRWFGRHTSMWTSLAAQRLKSLPPPTAAALSEAPSAEAPPPPSYQQLASAQEPSDEAVLALLDVDGSTHQGRLLRSRLLTRQYSDRADALAAQRTRHGPASLAAQIDPLHEWRHRFDVDRCHSVQEIQLLKRADALLALAIAERAHFKAIEARKQSSESADGLSTEGVLYEVRMRL